MRGCLKKTLQKAKVLVPQLLLVPIIGWPGTETKKWLLQNALLDKSRVLNSKCPKHFDERGGLEKESSASCAGNGKHM
jgi:hypothetical protein